MSITIDLLCREITPTREIPSTPFNTPVASTSLNTPVTHSTHKKMTPIRKITPLKLRRRSIKRTTRNTIKKSILIKRTKNIPRNKSALSTQASIIDSNKNVILKKNARRQLFPESHQTQPGEVDFSKTATTRPLSKKIYDFIQKRRTDSFDRSTLCIVKHNDGTINKLFKDKYDGQMIGVGTYGSVYRVNESCALKITHSIPSSGIDDCYAIERDLLFQLDHVNIIKLYGYIDSARTLIFKLYQKTLNSHLRFLYAAKKTMSNDEIRYTAKGILHGLQYLHSKNIIHRDLTPSNILIDENDNAVIADFGLGRKIDNMRSFTPGMVTLYYRPLEMLFLDGTVHANKQGTFTDIWSFGCILAEMAMGGLCFCGRGARLMIVDICKKMNWAFPELMDDFAQFYGQDLSLTEELGNIESCRKVKQYRDVIFTSRGVYEAVYGSLCVNYLIRSSATELLRMEFFEEKKVD